MISVDMNMSKQKVDIKLTTLDNQNDIININFNSNQDQKITQKKLEKKNSIKEEKVESHRGDGTPIKKIQDVKEELGRKLVDNKAEGRRSSKQQQHQTQKLQQQLTTSKHHHKSSTSSITQQQRLSLAQTLQKNKLLRQIFKHFCNMTYANPKKKTFEEMSKTNLDMSLNRFMIFCKQFNIDRIVRVEVIKSKKQTDVNGKSHKSKTNKSEEIESSKSSQAKMEGELKEKQKLPSPPKRPMLQIPVHNINNTQKTLTKLYQKYAAKYDHMTFQQFTTILLQIYNIYERNITELIDTESEKVPANTKQWIEDRFLSDVLAINDVKKFEEKMTNLKILFKGAISYHQEETIKKSPSFLSKKLVIHGGRSPEEMKKQLDIYQSDKIDKKQSWIDKQPQNIGVYSKSRVFYRPNPSTTYQTNEVLRLARKQAGRSQTQNLLIPESKTQKRQEINRKQSAASFSKLFEDKSNHKLSKKLLKINYQGEGKSWNDDKKRQHKRDKSKEKGVEMADDDILERYFENEKKVYGDEK